MSVRVVKIGGRPLGDAAWLERFSAAIAGAGGGLVIVHGGGPEVDVLSERLGVAVERVNGQRVTPPAAMDVTTMVLSGRINKRLVAALLSAGADAIGLSGEDGALVETELKSGGALGRVGEIVRVRASLLHQLLGLGLVPVLSPISRGPDGAAVNVNADDAATAIAVALGARELVFLTDVPAVRDGERNLAQLNPAEAADLLARGIAKDGMAVKLEAGLRALAAGVEGVRIGSFEALSDAAAGTRLLATAEVGA